MTTPLNGLSHFNEDGKYNLIKFMYPKKGEKLNRNQLTAKINEIESSLIALGAKEIKQIMIGQGTEQKEGAVIEPERTIGDVLNEIKAEDTDTEAIETKQNQLLRWVSESVQNNEELTRHVAAWSVEAIQLELLTGNTLLSQLN